MLFLQGMQWTFLDKDTSLIASISSKIVKLLKEEEWKNTTQVAFLSIHLKFQMPYYYPLNEWLLGATNDN